MPATLAAFSYPTKRSSNIAYGLEDKKGVRTLMMADKKREMPAEKRLTLAEARAQISKLKPTPRIEGKGGGAAAPYGISKSRSRKVKR